MKLTLRRLRWWLAPLVLVLLISVSITLTHVRHSRQMEAADVIAGIGGEVNVQYTGWRWLVRFTSNRYFFPSSHEPCSCTYTSHLGPDWFRSALGHAGFDSVINSHHVARTASICTGPPDPIASKEGESVCRIEDLPTFIDAASRLSTLERITIVCRSDCEIDLTPLKTLPHCERLWVSARGPDDLKFCHRDTPVLVPGPTMIFRKPTVSFPFVRVRLRGLASVSLKTLSLCGFDDEILSEVSECESVEELHLTNCRVTARGLHQLSQLRRLKVISLNSEMLTDETVEALTQLKTLESVTFHPVHSADDPQYTPIKSKLAVRCPDLVVSPPTEWPILPGAWRGVYVHPYDIIRRRNGFRASP